ncbi:MAG TPA: hypothetical protein VGC09_23265 [Rhodopila sp.]
MSDSVITVRLSQKQAAFLQQNLSLLATTTRQAMTRPGVEVERRASLGSRANLLETIEDAVNGALLELRQDVRKVAQVTESRQAVNLRSLSAA